MRYKVIITYEGSDGSYEEVFWKRANSLRHAIKMWRDGVKAGDHWDGENRTITADVAIYSDDDFFDEFIVSEEVTATYRGK